VTGKLTVISERVDDIPVRLALGASVALLAITGVVLAYCQEKMRQPLIGLIVGAIILDHPILRQVMNYSCDLSKAMKGV